jgi:hypothetical protein
MLNFFYSAANVAWQASTTNRVVLFVFVNVYEAQELISKNQFRRARDRFLGSLKGLQIRAQAT